MAYHKAVLKAEDKGSQKRHRKSREEEKKRKAEKRRNDIYLEGRDMKIIRDCGHCLHKDECPVPDEQWEDGECEYELPYWVKEKHPYWPDEGEDRS